jgi:hypothetical protein
MFEIKPDGRYESIAGFLFFGLISREDVSALKESGFYTRHLHEAELKPCVFNLRLQPL